MVRIHVMATLLGLRYRLLWAQARTRNGKVLLFVVGYLLLSVMAAMVALGGLGGALASIRLGKAETVARVALGAPFLCATLAAVLCGAGMRQVYAESFLRRYALRPVERLAARHFLAMLEPMWLLMAAWYGGLAAGFTMLGMAAWWKTIPAAVSMLAANYLFARAVLSVTEYVLATRWGTFALVGLVAVLFPLPAVVGPILARGGSVLGSMAFLQLTPPFAGAAILAAGSNSWAGWLLLLLVECGVLTGLIWAVDRLPAPSRTRASAKATWDEPWDRIAAVFGPELGPLVGKILRYYVRSPQLRFNYPTSALGVVFLTLQFGRGDPARGFLAALGVVAGIGSMSMGAMTMNVFGFDGSGFRRYFLLPVASAKVLRAAAIVPLILGAVLIPISLGIWLAVTRTRVDARMMVMLLGSGLAGLFVFQALGIWVSLLAPRAIGFQETFGNKLSFAANALMMANLFVMFGLMPLFQYLGAAVMLAHWWMLVVAALAGAGFYLATLRAGTAVFRARREQMLSTIERGFSF